MKTEKDEIMPTTKTAAELPQSTSINDKYGKVGDDKLGAGRKTYVVISVQRDKSIIWANNNSMI